MRIGVSALLFNIEEVLELVEKNKDIKHIEIGIDNLSDCDKLKSYKDKIEKLQLSVGIHLPMELNICEDIVFIRDSWVDYINAVCEKLRFLKIDYYNMHMGYVMSNRLMKNRKKYLGNAVEFLNKLYEKNEHIQITLENTYSKGEDFTNIGTCMEDFRYIFQNIDNMKSNNIKFCYDTGHDLICSSDYFSLGEKFKVVHLSDNNGIMDEHLGINKGILSKENIEKALSFKGEYLVLEMKLEHIEDSLATLKKNYYK